MKKILIVFSIILISLLTSCSSSNGKKADVYEYYINTSNESDLLNSISKVEDACVLIANTFYSNKKQYVTYTPGIIYKYKDGYYYALTVYSSNSSPIKDNVYVVLNEETYCTLTYIGDDPSNYVAVYKFKSDLEINCIKINENSNYNIGKDVFSIASLSLSLTYDDLSLNTDRILNYNFESYHNCVYSGNISRYNGRLIQHTALSSISNVGSPLFDYYGNFIGINFFKKYSELETGYIFGINQALSADLLYKSIKDIEEANGTVNKIDFGWSFKELTVPINSSNEYPEGFYSGIEILSNLGRNELHSGLRVGDIIYELNGFKITILETFVSQLAYLTYGDSINLKVYRKGLSGYESIELSN